MRWTDVDIIVLTIVDLCALGVGVTILRRVTKIVVETGNAIHSAVGQNINEARESAVDAFAEAVGPAISQAAIHLLPMITQLIESKVDIDVRDKPASDDRNGSNIRSIGVI